MKYTVLDYLEETAAKYPEKIAFADINDKVTWNQFVKNARNISYDSFGCATCNQLSYCLTATSS